VPPSLREPVISLGAGVQSSALLLMAVEGELAHLGEPSLAIFADTGWEPAATYEWLGFLRLASWKAGIEIATVSGGDLRAEAIAAAEGGGSRFASMPLYIANPDGSKGILRRQCSKEYKIAPVRRELRRRGLNSVEMWLGISRDEIERQKPADVQWVANRHPLIELQMSRADCSAWLADHGFPEPPKSACLGCPYTDDHRWFDMRENRPEEWADAVEADRALRQLPRVDSETFLHRSLVPLEDAVLDPSDVGQLDLQGECEGVCFV
jgi:hypothetical protein